MVDGVDFVDDSIRMALSHLRSLQTCSATRARVLRCKFASEKRFGDTYTLRVVPSKSGVIHNLLFFVGVGATCNA